MCKKICPEAAKAPRQRIIGIKQTRAAIVAGYRDLAACDLLLRRRHLGDSLVRSLASVRLASAALDHGLAVRRVADHDLASALDLAGPVVACLWGFLGLVAACSDFETVGLDVGRSSNRSPLTTQRFLRCGSFKMERQWSFRLAEVRLSRPSPSGAQRRQYGEQGSFASDRRVYCLGPRRRANSFWMKWEHRPDVALRPRDRQCSVCRDYR